MVTSLFSSFDPAAGFEGMSLNWLSTPLGVLLLPYLYWVAPGRVGVLISGLLNTLSGELKMLLGPGAYSIAFGFLGLFLLIVFNNTLGLVPYIFTSTGHMSLTLSLALPMWVSFMLFGWINHTQHMFAHLIPQGTPGPLMVFMVLVETVSNVIRPGTLAIRLSANMIAGHLLLTLIGNVGPSLSALGVVGLVVGQNLLMLLEMAVSMIQAYVFMVLVTLYAAEVN